MIMTPSLVVMDNYPLCHKYTLFSLNTTLTFTEVSKRKLKRNIISDSRIINRAKSGFFVKEYKIIPLIINAI